MGGASPSALAEGLEIAATTALCLSTAILLARMIRFVFAMASAALMNGVALLIDRSGECEGDLPTTNARGETLPMYICFVGKTRGLPPIIPPSTVPPST